MKTLALVVLTAALLAFAGYFGYRYYRVTRSADLGPLPTPTPIIIPVQMGQDVVAPSTPVGQF